jgi:hypothetical protein
MRRRQALPAVGLVIVAVVTALVVVFASSLGGGDGGRPSLVPRDDIDPRAARPPGAGLPREGIEASGTLVPRITLFGDTVVARVDVFLDRRRVDPESVLVGTEFLPWAIVGERVRLRRDAGPTTLIRTTFALRCTTGPCVPPNEATALQFDPGRVSYAAPGAAPGHRASLTIEWPVLLVYSRFAAANAEAFAGPVSQNPWRADLETFSVATYRMPPGVVIAALLVLAGLLAAAGAALAYLAIPRRQGRPEPEPEPEPAIVLTPLEQALELLEDAERADGTQDRRRALELVAEVLDLGHPDIARVARALAWSADDPQVEQTVGLATRVRASIDMNGNGHAG